MDPGTYYLRIGGASQASGVMKLKVGTFAIPEHDLFSGARQITNLPYADPVDVSTYTVGRESGEPDPYSTKEYCGHNRDTVWYKYTPSAHALLTADIYGTQGVLFNTVIAVYKQTGSSISTLELVDCNSDNHNFGNGLQSSVAVNAEAGETYYFQVGGYWGATGSLRFRLQSAASLINDYILPATQVPSLPTVTTSATFDAAIDATIATLTNDEPQPCGGIAATMWYRYDNALSGALEIALSSGGFRSVIAVYEVDPLTSELRLRACQVGTAPTSNNPSSNILRFPAAPGLRYLYQVGGYKGDSGEMEITFSQVPD